MFGFLFLCQFAENDGFQVHVPTKDMNSSVFYGCIVFHGVYVPIFPVQSIISGHLGWFQVCALINSTAMNIYVHVSL